MDTIPSAQFRKVYAKLREATEVTVNGHLIGTWVPADWNRLLADIHEAGTALIEKAAGKPAITKWPDGSVKRVRMGQAERDAVLRRINKGG